MGGAVPCSGQGRFMNRADKLFVFVLTIQVPETAVRHPIQSLKLSSVPLWAGRGSAL